MPRYKSMGKKRASKDSSSSKGKESANSHTPPPKRSKKKMGGSFSPFQDELSQAWYVTTFSTRGLLIKRLMTLDALCTVQLYELINARGWMPILLIKGSIHNEAVRIFYSNIFDENFRNCSFYLTIYKILISINLDFISTFLGIPRVADAIPFPPRHISEEDKAEMTHHLCGKTVRWITKLAKNDCRSVVQFLFRVFTYILPLTTHRSGLTIYMAYLIDSILEGKRIDLPYIICYVFLRVSAIDHSTGSWPFLVLISQIFKTQKVSL